MTYLAMTFALALTLLAGGAAGAAAQPAQPTRVPIAVATFSHETCTFCPNPTGVAEWKFYGPLVRGDAVLRQGGYIGGFAGAAREYDGVQLQGILSPRDTKGGSSGSWVTLEAFAGKTLPKVKDGVAQAIAAAKAGKVPVVVADHSDRTGNSSQILEELIRQGAGKLCVATISNERAITALEGTAKACDRILIKSRVHFWRGFVEDGLAKAVVVIDAPGLGPADVSAIPYRNASRDTYPIVRKERTIGPATPAPDVGEVLEASGGDALVRAYDFVKNSRWRRSRSGIDTRTPMRFGIAIRPFRVSATSHTRCSEPVAPR